MDNQNDDFFMKPKVDFAFKEIMMDDDALKGFLSAVLNINPAHIQKIIRKNTNMQKVHDNEKQAILDVRIVIGQGEPPKKQLESEEEQTEREKSFIFQEIDIEIQLAFMAAWADRSVFYVAKMFTEQGEINKKYSNFKKCIGINILNTQSGISVKIPNLSNIQINLNGILLNCRNFPQLQTELTFINGRCSSMPNQRRKLRW